MGTYGTRMFVLLSISDCSKYKRFFVSSAPTRSDVFGAVSLTHAAFPLSCLPARPCPTGGTLSFTEGKYPCHYIYTVLDVFRRVMSTRASGCHASASPPPPPPSVQLCISASTHANNHVQRWRYQLNMSLSHPPLLMRATVQSLTRQRESTSHNRYSAAGHAASVRSRVRSAGSEQTA